MPIQIQTLLSNVVIQREGSAGEQPAMFDTPSVLPASESLQPLPERTMEDSLDLEQPPSATLSPSEQAAITAELEEVIVQAVTDRVFRLMRDDLSIAHERE